MITVNNRKLMITISFLIMAILGIIASIPGQINPLIQEEFRVSFSKLSFLQILYTLGSIIVTFTSGILLTKVGLKKFYLWGLLVAIIILISFYTINYFWILLILMAFLGSSMGNLVVSSQTIASILFTEKRGKMMNLNHVFFGFGSIIGPYYAVRVLKIYGDWKLVYVFSGVLIVFLFLFSVFGVFPKNINEINDDGIQISNLLKDYKLLMIIFILILNTGAELTIRNWLGIYLKSILNKNQQEISIYLISFNFLFTIGRLIAFFIVEKVGYYLMVLISSIGTFIILLLALLNPSLYNIGFSISGLFLSINFPTIQAILFDMYNEKLSQVVGLSLASAGIGGLLLGNLFIGFFSDIGGIRIGMSMILLYIGLSIATLFVLRIKLYKK